VIGVGPDMPMMEAAVIGVGTDMLIQVAVIGSRTAMTAWRVHRDSVATVVGK
jgi:hypothetical protein